MIYLVSVSPRRKALMKSFKKPFRMIAPLYDESKEKRSRPSALVKRHALGKALSVVPKIRSGILISADTIVYFKGKIIGKPRDLNDAFKVLGRLAGNWHSVYTGVAVLQVEKGKPGKRRIYVEKTKIRLKPMDRAARRGYFRKVNPLDKAGAYAIQSKTAGIVTEVRGSFTNAVGLPMESLTATLRRFFVIK